MKNKTPEWILERIALNENNSNMTERDLSAADNERIDEIQKSDTEILERYKPDLMVGDIIEKYRNARLFNRLLNLFSLKPQLVAAAGLALVVLLVLPVVNYYSRDNATTLKGIAPYINIYKKQELQAIKLNNGDRVKSGDVIQVSYFALGYRYGIIFSIDGNNQVTYHLAGKNNGSVPLLQGGETALPDAVELDDAAGYEKFYFVLSNDRFKAADVIDGSGKVNNTLSGFYRAEFNLVK
ncbi:MAG: hypothetical protein JXA66_02725 [Oligoflexia bacterium]|nr:hypothetical protein [Oligoflexia bacterium]